jgi:hypothetical protein
MMVPVDSSLIRCLSDLLLLLIAVTTESLLGCCFPIILEPFGQPFFGEGNLKQLRPGAVHISVFYCSYSDDKT